MKKLKLFSAFVIVAVCLVACDNGETYYGDGYDSELNNLYSNKTYTQPGAGSLELTYGGDPLVGKDIYFEMRTSNTARIALNNIIPGEDVIYVEDITVKPGNDGKYYFDGSSTSKGISVSAVGIVQSGRIQLNLDVKMPDNLLSGLGTYEFPFEFGMGDNPNYDLTYVGNQGFYLEWRYDDPVMEADGATVRMLFSNIVSGILYLLVPELSFHTDGNITAAYTGFHPDYETETVMFMAAFGALTEEFKNPDISYSPRNLITYTVSGDKIYIRPDVGTIIHTIQTNNAIARSEEEAGISVDQIISMVLLLKDWMDKGIEFTLEKWDPSVPMLVSTEYTSMAYYYEGDYVMYMDKKTLQPLLSVLPIILEMIDFDLGGMIDLNTFINNLNQTSTLKLGFFLHKNQ